MLRPETQLFDESLTNDGSGQHEQCVVDVQPTLEADTQLAKAGKPRMGSLHHPAMFTQALAAFDAPPGNPA